MKSPAYIAKHIRTVLKNGGSAPHTVEVQRFFKHQVKSRGWYTGELRKVAVRFRRTILAEHGMRLSCFKWRINFSAVRCWKKKFLPFLCSRDW